MAKVIIYGAGSIGNHLAYACRSKGWDVALCDIDKNALERARNEIYPMRYGAWDKNIRLLHTGDLSAEPCELIIIGTPPDVHIKLAIAILRNRPPKVLLIEKPLCAPNFVGCRELLSLAKSCGTFVIVGYNHVLTGNTSISEELFRNGFPGFPLTITAKFCEHWKGIFAAHPWLKGPQDSYLGFSLRGGGASGEHSHAINIWQHFSHLLDMGRIVEVSAILDLVKTEGMNYDRICQLSVRTEKGLVGSIIQDVITEPPEKNLRIQFSSGFLEWYVNFDKNHDLVRYGNGKDEPKDYLISKSRPDDFIGEINHIEKILSGSNTTSPISLERALDTMLVVAAAHISNQFQKTVKINYTKGYCTEAIEA